MNKTSILIIDDEAGILETICDILDIKGYDVTTASNGVKGVELVQAHHFDLVLTDIVMPEMNGIEACHHIKRISPDTKVIMMTGYGAEHSLVRTAIDSGAEQILHKPFDISELLYAIGIEDIRVACIY